MSISEEIINFAFEYKTESCKLPVLPTLLMRVQAQDTMSADKKKKIKYILWGMWIVYMGVGMFCFIYNENDKGDATIEHKDNSTESNTFSAFPIQTDSLVGPTHIHYSPSDLEEDESEDIMEREITAFNNGDIDADSVTDFDEVLPGDICEPEFVEGDRPDPELYIQDDNENR